MTPARSDADGLLVVVELFDKGLLLLLPLAPDDFPLFPLLLPLMLLLLPDDDVNGICICVLLLEDPPPIADGDGEVTADKLPLELLPEDVVVPAVSPPDVTMLFVLLLLLLLLFRFASLFFSISASRSIMRFPIPTS